jgi:hypothetical protein
LGTWRESPVAIKQLMLDNASGGILIVNNVHTPINICLFVLATFDKELRAFQDEAQVMKV